MNKRRTAEEKRRYTEDNGFNGNNKDVNDTPIPRDVLDYAKGKNDVKIIYGSKQGGIKALRQDHDENTCEVPIRVPS